MAKSEMRISPAFDDFIFNWDHEVYLAIGSYGSGKSHAICQKLIIKCYEEKRKVCIFREVYDTHKESTFDLLRQILTKMDLLCDVGVRKHPSKVCYKLSPLEFKFPNGSRIIFKGMDNTEKLKSLNDVSIVWVEECSEISVDAYTELLGRIRPTEVKPHFILSCNPVGKFNWVYRYFFEDILEDGSAEVKLSDRLLYKYKAIVREGIYYHHSTCDDNPFIGEDYIRRLDEIRKYDPTLWTVARLGMFGASGLRVLPQFEVMNYRLVEAAVVEIPAQFHKCGMDFGFEKSYNAVVKFAIDDKHKWLYIYDEYYRNKMTDDRTAEQLVKWDPGIKNVLIKADCAEPKTIKYYRQEGFRMLPCKKKADKKSEGSRIANTRKIKRFRRIICSSRCTNAIRELRDLTYLKNPDGSLNYGKFNIDSHVLSCLWYGADDYTVADVKERTSNSRKGS